MKKQLAVAENLNFARAAEVLKITTSAVSRQIRALEDESDTRLLHRSTRTVTLTPAGIVFLNDDEDFKAAHPELPVEKKSDSPDEDKSVGDSKALVPVLTDFFTLHPDFHPDTFLGDSAFDSAELYDFLINDFHFSKALILYNPRNESSLKKVGYNEYGFFIF